MNVVGLGRLTAFATEHPLCAGTIWAMHSLLATARWRSPQDASAQLGSLVEIIPQDRMAITTRTEPRLRITVQIHYTLGLACIEAIEVL